MKIKAFTILEITVVMLITSLVVSFGYGGYLMVEKHIYSTKKKQIVSSESTRLRQAINHEFFTSDSILWNGEIQQLSFNDGRSIRFDDSLAILNVGILDTFDISIFDLNIQEVQLPDNRIVVKSISLKVDQDDDDSQLELSVVKHYTPYVLEGL